MKIPNYYFDIAVKHCGSVYMLSKDTGIDRAVLYRKQDKCYKVGEDMFTLYWHLEAIRKATDGLVTPENLCQSIAKNQST